jgi:hypothetical protein
MKLVRTAEYAKGNTEAAEILLQNPEQYGAGLVTWARAWQAAHPPKVRRWERPAVAQHDGAQLRLFGQGEGAEAK